jgi:hypothetical protein
MIKRLLPFLLLLVAVSARAGEPPLTLHGARERDSVAACIDDGLRKLKLPASFIAPLRRDDSSASLGLINPLTGGTGLTISIASKDPGSEVTITSNGTPLSPGWRRMIQRCVD